jgi:uncharacterized protein YbjT (DUF2867 family)
MRIVVTGASGFIGSLLVPRLCSDGHTVRALGRDPARVREALAYTSTRHPSTRRPLDDVQVARADVLSGEDLAHALDGAEVAYYLIHSMERAGAGTPFFERDHVAAEHFAQAAIDARVRRIVYLGGLTSHERVSRHLSSREHVERVLLDAVPDSIALRASIVIGARSRSFRLLVRLLERMPLLTLPDWHKLRTQPIDARDMIEMLTACASAQPPRRALDVGGPDVLSYGEMLRRIAEQMLVNRPAIELGVNLTPLAARVAAAIADEDPELVVALMEGLQADLLPADHHAAELLGVRLHSFEAAVEHALAEWERSEPLAAR